MDHRTLAYLATPYSRYRAGPDQACTDASIIAGRLLRSGINVYSPIAHTHAIAGNAGIDPFDHSIWLPFDEIIMSRCDVLIVAHMEGWQESKGIAHEIEFFERAGKPIFDLVDVTTISSMAKRKAAPLPFEVADHQRERIA